MISSRPLIYAIKSDLPALRVLLIVGIGVMEQQAVIECFAGRARVCAARPIITASISIAHRRLDGLSGISTLKGITPWVADGVASNESNLTH